jgi:hypothetical protein
MTPLMVASTTLVPKIGLTALNVIVTQPRSLLLAKSAFSVPVFS